jgi:glycosyltransferase involved in cell wall biosynthesis
MSIVVPLFNEAKGLPGLHERIAEVARYLENKRELTVEVVYVDDGSSDGTSDVAKSLPAIPVDIQVVTLSRNFGKEAALLAGLETLVARWLDDGYDVVYTAKANRENETWARRTGVRWFYALLNWGSRHKIPEDAGDFRLLSARAAAALRQMPERNRFFKGLSSWIGFRQVRVDYEPALRQHGATTWSIWSLVGLSIEGLTSFSVAPLRVASLLGVLLAVTALFFGSWIVLQTLLYGQDVPGYPSLVVSVMVIGGVQLILIGVLGEYIGKLLSESKARPVYFVAEHSVKRASGSAKTRPITSRAAE